MADNEYDLDPGEQKLRVAGQILADEERDIAGACETLLLRLADPVDLDPGTEFYRFRLYSDKARREELCRRAARAAMAVLLADDGMQLPTYIEIAYDMPKSPAIEFQWLLSQQRTLNASLVNLAAELKAQRSPGVHRLLELARQAHAEIASEATQREHSGNGEEAAGIKQLVADLGQAIREAAA